MGKITAMIDLMSFFYGTGIALFIALIAWGDNIRKPGEEVLSIEDKFRNILKLKKAETIPLLRESSKYNFSKQMETIAYLWEKDFKGKDLQLLSEIKELHKKRSSLDSIYDFRYLLVFFITILSFFFGGLSLLIGRTIIFNYQDFLFTNNKAYLLVFMIAIFITLINLYCGYNKEKEFVEKIRNISDKIEG